MFALGMVFMTKSASYMFITGPEVVKSVTRESVTKEDLGGAMTHNAKSGVAHFAPQDDAECIAQIRELFGYLPLNNAEDNCFKHRRIITDGNSFKDK